MWADKIVPSRLLSAAKKLQHQAIVKSLAEVFSLEPDVKGFQVIDIN